MMDASVTLSLVSHGQAALCSELLGDLARIRPAAVARLVLTLNVPEDVPPMPALPFTVDIVRNARPLGFAANHNQAFVLCSTPYFAVLNPDLRFATDPFPALLDRLAEPQIGIVSPRVLEADGSIADHVRRLTTPLDVVRRRVLGATPRPPGPPDWIAGMFMMFRAVDFRRLAGFDEKFRLYCEDVDICARARLAGMHLAVVDKVAVTHLARRASRRALRPLLWHVSSLLKFWASDVYRDYRMLLKAESVQHGNAA